MDQVKIAACGKDPHQDKKDKRFGGRTVNRAGGMVGALVHEQRARRGYENRRGQTAIIHGANRRRSPGCRAPTGEQQVKRRHPRNKVRALTIGKEWRDGSANRITGQHGNEEDFARRPVDGFVPCAIESQLCRLSSPGRRHPYEDRAVYLRPAASKPVRRPPHPTS